MTRKEAKELLPIIQAFAEGKRIEYGNGNDDDWSETETPTWDTDFVYRIKPKPAYRPFKNKEECWNEMLKHEPFGWLKNSNNKYINLVSIDKTRAELSPKDLDSFDNIVENSMEFDCMFEEYKFIDDTPFGIKED